MKEFDINKIGREMPYKAPDKDFFENFTQELLSKVEQKPKSRITPLRRLAPLFGVAAAVAVIITATLDFSKGSSSWADEYIGESLDKSLDAYFASLSDEELAYLVTESSYNDDFYSILPNN